MNHSKLVVLLVVFFAMLLIFSRCTAVRSWFDDVYLVHQFNTPVNGVGTPEGFVVTLDEILKIIPITKYGWNIYADKENYYLSKGIQRLFAKTGDNSFLARKNGIRIAGKHRRDYKLIEEYLKKENRKRPFPGELEKIFREK